MINLNKRKYSTPEEARAASNAKKHESYTRLRNERRAAGLCVYCGREREPSRGEKRLCFRCACKASARQNALRARKALEALDKAD